jgi:ankyrin repeat protein
MRFLLIVAITSLAFIGTALAGPIHDAAKAGDVAKVRQLLANGAKVDAREEDGWTPLHWAAFEGQADVVRVLLAAGAKVDARSESGKTPLHRAAWRGHADVVKVLLAAGAKVDARHKYGLTPLHEAALGGHADVVRILVAFKAGVASVRDGDGKTPFDLAKSNGKLQDKDPGTYWLLNDLQYE